MANRQPSPRRSLRNARNRSDPRAGIRPQRRRVHPGPFYARRSSAPHPTTLSSMRRFFRRLVAGMSTGHFLFPYFINCICFFSDLKY
ncbi:hypothetical protein ISCGN_016314 [Ixodes scapularis]